MLIMNWKFPPFWLDFMVLGTARRSRVISSLTQLSTQWTIVMTSIIRYTHEYNSGRRVIGETKHYWISGPLYRKMYMPNTVNMNKNPQSGNSHTSGLNLLLLLCYMDIVSNFPLNTYCCVHRSVQLWDLIQEASFHNGLFLSTKTHSRSKWEKMTVTYSALNGTSISYPFSSKLRDPCRGR